MHPRTTIRGLALLLSAWLPTDAIAQDAAQPSDWPSFRGNRARGTATGPALPTTWDLESGANVRWRTPIPGLSYSSPIVWGDRVFVTTAVRLEGQSVVKVGLYGSPNSAPEEGPHRFQVFCLDRERGDVIWSRTAIECAPDTKRHPKGSFAASTPATDGRHVAAFFGSEGLFVYTMDGDLVWSTDFGVLDAGWYVAPDAQFGYAASPVIHDGLLFVQADVQENPFLAALDLATGDEVWRVARDEVPTWSTPTVDVEHGREQLLVNGYRHMGAYDLRTGAELWKMADGGDVPVPTPIVAFDKVFLTNGHGQWNPIYCVDIDAAGVIEDGFDADTEPHVVWSQRRQGTYMQTPIIIDDLLFAANDSGVVSCIDAESGDLLNRRRLGSGKTGFTASPVSAGGNLYFTSEVGEIHVIRADAEMDEVAVNDMHEICLATPAISNGALIVRTRHHLVSLAAGADGAPIDAVALAPEPEPAPAGTTVEWIESGEETLPTAESLLTRHLDARGGIEKLRAVGSLTVIAEWEMVGIGMTGRSTNYHRTPNMFLSTSDIPGMGEMLQGFDGKVAWMKGGPVGEMILQGELAAEVRRQAQWAPELDLMSRLHDVKTLGRGHFGGKECFVVEGKTKLGKPERTFFDVETGRLHARDMDVTTVGGVTRVIEVQSGHIEFGGIAFPTEVRQLFPDDAIEMVVRTEKVAFDDVPAARFAVPEGLGE